MYIPFAFVGANKNQYLITACNSTASYVITFDSSQEFQVGSVVLINNNPTLTDCYTITSIQNNVNFNFNEQSLLASFTNCVSCSNSFVSNGLIINLDSSSYSNSGSIWYDVSGNSNNGLVSGTINFNTNSKTWEFTSGSYITFSGSLNNQPTSSYTLQWIGKLPQDTLEHTLFDRGFFLSSSAPLVNGWDFVYDSDNKGFIYRNRQNILNDRSLFYTASNDFYLFTLSATQGGTISLYSNNNLIGTLQAPQATEPVFAFNQQFTTASFIFGFGSNDDGSDVTYNGSLSNFYLYNRALSSFEVNRNFNYLSSSIFSINNSCLPNSLSGLPGDIYYTTAQPLCYTTSSTSVNNLFNGITGFQLDGTFVGTYNSTDNAWNGQINLNDFIGSNLGLDYGTWFFLAKIPTGSVQREFLGSQNNARYVGIDSSGRFGIQGGIYTATSSLNLSSVSNFSTQYKVYVWERTSSTSSQFRIEDDNFATAYPTQIGGLPYQFLTGMDEICKSTGNIKAIAAYNVDSSVSPLTRMSVSDINRVASLIKSGVGAC